MFTFEFWAGLDTLDSIDRSIKAGWDGFSDLVGSHAISNISISAFFTYTFCCFGCSLKFEKISWLAFTGLTSG